MIGYANVVRALELDGRWKRDAGWRALIAWKKFGLAAFKIFHRSTLSVCCPLTLNCSKSGRSSYGFRLRLRWSLISPRLCSCSARFCSCSAGCFLRWRVRGPKAPRCPCLGGRGRGENERGLACARYDEFCCVPESLCTIGRAKRCALFLSDTAIALCCWLELLVWLI